MIYLYIIKITMGKNFLKDNLSSKLGGAKIQLMDLLDDDSYQIIMSKNLFNSFDNSSKNKKYYDKEVSLLLFRYVIFLYNDTIECVKKYGSLTYLERIINCLDYITPQQIMELSLQSLNSILDESNR